MAKRKRASLKDKSPETLGLTQKKGKGMDLLFGGSLDKEQAATDQPEEVNESDAGLSGLLDTLEPSATQQTGVNGGVVDELGLPVALEAPPDDLILAAGPVDPAPEDEAEGNLATSPFAMPAEETAQASGSPDEQNDLSGIIMEDDSAIVEEEKVSSTEETNNLSGILQDTPPTPVEQGDLSGLAQESDLSGLVVETQSVPSATPADFSTPVSPQTTAAPINAPAFQPEVASAGAYPAAPAMPAETYATPYPAAPPMSQAAPAPGYAQPYPPIAPQAPPPAPSPIQISQAPAAVVGALSAFGETIPITRDSFKPQDELPSDDTELVVKEVTLAERDDDITRQVLQYVGAERRDKLFNEIETLYGLVSAKLNGNKKDVNFALDTLRQAHNLILESPREYDEAFYRVAVVKTILNRKTDLSSWSYSWGLFVLLYGILWLTACLAGGYYIIVNAAQLLDPIMSLPFQSLFCAFAGGIGGCVAVLWTLYYRVSVKQDFDRQYLMFYLVKPILGFVLGLVMFFLLISASSIGASSDLQLGFDTATGVALAAFVGFIAGFRQDNVYDWIYVIIKTISPKANEEASGKTALVPPDIAKEYEEKVEAKQVKVTLS